MNSSKNKISYITLLSVIAMTAVVFLHANTAFWNFRGDLSWTSANLIESFFYFAAPAFFMITGATLMDFSEKYSLKEYFKKRFWKTVFPFIVWSIIGIFYHYIVVKHGDFSGLNLKTFVNHILKSDTVPIYWFFPSLFSVYLSIPLFAAVPKEKRNRIFTYLVLIGFILNVFLPFVVSVFAIDLYLPLSVSTISGYPLYALLGYLLSRNEMKKSERIVIYILGILGFLSQFIGTEILSLKAGEIIQTWKGYNNVPCILQTMAVFVFIKQVGTKWMENKIFSRIINFIARYTFSVYLLHWFFLNALTRLFDLNNTTILYRLGMVFVVIPLSILTAWLIQKIPFVKKILPN